MNKKIDLILNSVVLTLFFVGIFTFITIPEYMLISVISFIIAIIGLVVICLRNKAQIIKFMASKFGRNILDNIIGFFLVFCILGLINYMAFKRPIIWDLGERKLNSLTEQTRKVLDGYKEEVNVTIFSSPDQRQAIANFLQLYSGYNSNITVNYVDPEIRSDLVSLNGITISPSLLVENKDKTKKQIITQIKELTLTNSLITLKRVSNPLLCFNYSSSYEDMSENGYTGIIHVLKQSAFDLKIINLLQAQTIPNECQVYSVISPISDFTDEEIRKIDDYYVKGGVLFFALSPMLNGDKLTKLRKYILKHNIIIDNNVVIDNKFHVNGSRGSAPIVKEFDSIGINSSTQGQVFFPISSEVKYIDLKVKNEDYIPLARSSNDSWAENTIIELMSENLKFDELDVLGPIDMGVAKRVKEKAKLIVLGNGSLISNKFYKYQSNFQYILNLYFWSSGEDQLTSVQANVIEDRPIFISVLQKKVIFYFSILLMPLVFVFIGILQYRRRKYN